MESIKNLINRFWPTGGLVVAGVMLIIYIAFGFLYLQQGAKQREFEEQIIKLSPIVAKPLPPSKDLQEASDNVSKALAPKTASEYITMLVKIAEKSGIDVSEDSGKFRVPSAVFSEAKVGGSTYRLISFRNIHVQGDYKNVMAFISDLDSGKTLETMVLKRVAASEVEVLKPGDEARRAEFSRVTEAVNAMMRDNELSMIPNPLRYANRTATNIMGVDPLEPIRILGFPDITTTAEGKGYTGDGSPRDGYVLYGHDKISTDNTTLFETVNYIEQLNTWYYYTSEADGTVRQWDGPDVFNVKEHLNSEEFKTEAKIAVDIDIYTKP